MKKFGLSIVSVLFTVLISAQIPANYTATDCNNVTKSIHTQIGQTGKSIIVMSKGVDCSACRFSAPGWRTWSDDTANTNKVEVWAAMTYRYNPMTFSNPCNAITTWNNQYSWTNIYAFHDVNRDFLGPAMPRYYVYSAIDSSLIYNGSSATTARSLATQNSVVGIQELNKLKTIEFRMDGHQIIVNKAINDRVNLRLVDLNGKVVNDIQLTQYQTAIDINHLSKGIYIANLMSEGSAYSTKLLIP